MAKKCMSRKKEGARCRADAQPGKDICIFHDPAKADDGRLARRTGGVNRSRPAAVLPPNTPNHSLSRAADVSSLLADSINHVRRGELDPRIATTIGYLASIQLRSLEQGRNEERLAKIEESLGLLAVPQLGSPKPEPNKETQDEHEQSTEQS